MGKNTHRIPSAPSPREVAVLIQKFLQSEAHKSDTPFSMEQYFQWLENSPYFKYLNHSADLNYELKVNKERKKAILWFGRFVLSGKHDGIDVAFCSDCVYLKPYDLVLPFMTLEAAKEATVSVLDFLLLPRVNMEKVGNSRVKFERNCDRLMEQIKGSGLRYVLEKNGTKGTLYVSFISVAESMQSCNYEVLKCAFSASTKETDLALIADYVLKYKHFNDKYKMFNCRIEL